MFTPSVFARVKEQPLPAVVIIWRRKYGIWDYFTRATTREEAEAIVTTDSFLTGLGRHNYDVKQG